MKTINVYIIIIMIFNLTSCSEHYKLDTAFFVPDTFSNPENVNIDLQSNMNIVLSWMGGGAEDGGVLLYEVLFDSSTGNFSKPIYKVKSDLGTKSQLTINAVTLNRIARLAGIKNGETGSLKWTVTASRGGIINRSPKNGTIQVKRPDEEIPETLYLLGTATENNGVSPMPFRKESEGVFVIYTKIYDGNINFIDSEKNGVMYTIDEKEKVVEGKEEYKVKQENGIVRLTLNFNTKSFKKEVITDVKMIWGYTFDQIADLKYEGDGILKADNVKIMFYDPNDFETNIPSGLTWVEERYYFIATFSDGRKLCWGSYDEDNAQLPGERPTESYYEIHEHEWRQWKWLWKMDHKLQKKHCTITINTNANNRMIHSFTNIK